MKGGSRPASAWETLPRGAKVLAGKDPALSREAELHPMVTKKSLPAGLADTRTQGWPFLLEGDQPHTSQHLRGQDRAPWAGLRAGVNPRHPGPSLQS